jgi:hypothetical protein
VVAKCYQQGEFKMKMQEWMFLLILVAAILCGADTFAQEIQMLNPSSVGTGCPQGSVSFSVSPDNTAISALFSSYSISIGGSSHQAQSRLNCTLTLPLQLPAGLQVAIVGLDYRGFLALPKEGKMVFKTKDGYRINGNKYEDTADGDHEFKGVFNDNFIISRRKREVKWSNCGGRIDLTLQTQVIVETNSRNEEALFALDSADLSAGFHYRLLTNKCRSGNERQKKENH